MYCLVIKSMSEVCVMNNMHDIRKMIRINPGDLNKSRHPHNLNTSVNKNAYQIWLKVKSLYMCICMCICACMYICVCMIVCMCMSIDMHMSAFIITLMDVLIIYLFNNYVHVFVFKTYTPYLLFRYL